MMPQTQAAASSPPRLHLVGLKNAGKTTLMVDLVRELSVRGLLVGTIKHSPHEHTLDVPGTDSFRHREAGGSPSAFVTSDGAALFLPRPPANDPYAALLPHFSRCDLILVEGDLESRAPKFEVWRSGLERPPLALRHPGILAVISDDSAAPQLPCWPRSPVNRLADRLLRIALRAPAPARSRLPAA